MKAWLGACPCIVFDIGNVLLDFSPQRILDKLVTREEHELFRRFVLSGPEWVMLDRGDLDNQKAAQRICRHPEMRGKEEAVTVFLREFPRLMPPLPASRLLDQLHTIGKRLFLLSNFHAEAFQTVFELHPFFQKADGMIISSHVHCLKPEKEIYHLLFKKYDLIPGDCLFLDDVLENVEAAKAEGMQAIYYTSHDQIVELLHE